MIDRIRGIILKFTTKNKYKIPSEYGYNGTIYYCDNHSFYINSDTIETLLNSIDEKYKNAGNLIILNCILRYGVLLDYYQTTFSDKFYELLHDKFNVTIEGLSSPFNCMLLKYGGNIKFCSLFYDTDKYFGSLGNLFSLDIKKYKNEVIYLNSSSHNLFYKTTKFVYENIKNNNFLLILYSIPKDYERSKYFYLIKDSKNCTYYRQLHSVKLYNRLHNYVYATETVNVFNIGKHNPNVNNLVNILKGNDTGYIEISKEEQKMIYIEYYRLTTSLKILNLYNKNNMEWRNIIERFLNNIANTNSNGDIIFKSVKNDNRIFKALLDEMIEKHINNAGDLLKEIYNIVNNFNININYQEMESFKFDDNVIYYKDKMFNVNPRIIKILTLNSKKYDKDSNPLVHILCMIIRYEAMLSGSQHWNIPYNYYKYVNEMYNVKVEGFSSPLNSQLLLVDNNSYFCSLFYDVDKYFGSIGSFFDLDIVKYYEEYKKKHGEYLSISINPPYVEILIEKMVETINKWILLIPKIRFFVGLPYWTNFKPIDDINENKLIKYKKIFKKGDYYYEGKFGEITTQIYSTGKSKYIFWVISNFDLLKNEKEYNSIEKYFNPARL